MADISKLLSDLQSGSGIFSPISPFRSEKRLARAVGPAVVAAAGGVQRQGIASAGAIQQTGISTKGGIIQEGMQQEGAAERQEIQEEGLSHRKKLAIAGDKVIAEMTAKNRLDVQSLANEGTHDVAKVRGRYAYDSVVDPINAENSMILDALQNRRNQPEYLYDPNAAATPAKKKKEDDESYLDVSVN